VTETGEEIVQRCATLLVVDKLRADAVPMIRVNVHVRAALVIRAIHLLDYHDPRLAGHSRQPAASSATNSVVLCGILSCCCPILVARSPGMGFRVLFPVRM
jgi:hypothetical protein